MDSKWWSRLGLVLLLGMGFVATPASADIPEQTYESLGIPQDAPPDVLYEALAERYHSFFEKNGQGKYRDLWEPIAISKYLNPNEFYEPPAQLDFKVERGGCLTCHAAMTPGIVKAWEKSFHSDPQAIRDLPADDPRAYKKEVLANVEKNLRLQGLLGEQEKLSQVGCIDCHMGVGVDSGNHAKDLRLPDVAACGQCHVQQFAEQSSQLDTLNWPQDQWPDGRPSHAMDYKAAVELTVWAAMDQREIATGCVFCHTNQIKCDNCHTRHQFSPVEARKPEACAVCHNGVDHNEFENYMMSKHGTVYRTLGDTWNWQYPLPQAIAKGGMTAPTCAFCHMEYNGKFGHNLVRKVRWGFLPFPSIAENLDQPWFEKRKAAWIGTCTNCHSPRFAQAYFEVIDNGTKAGVRLVEKTRAVVEKLHEDGLMRGQKTNRPAPPGPLEDAPGAFFGLFWAEGNNPSIVDIEFTRMWEQDVAKLFKGLAHMNPGGYTYTEGWSILLNRYIRIMDEATELREEAALKAKVERLEQQVGEDQGSQDKQAMLLRMPVQPAVTGGLGGTLFVAGAATLGFAFRRRAGRGDGHK